MLALAQEATTTVTPAGCRFEKNQWVGQPKPLFTAIAIGYYLFPKQFPHGL